MNVVLAGGGTAGHVFPALAVADALRRRGAGVTFVGAVDGQEAALVPAAGYPFVPVRVLSAQTRVSLHAVRALVAAVRAARSVRPVIARADVVVGVGGFGSAPGVLAARWTKRPVVLVDQNSVPGAVNRIAARWARVVATTFDATAGRLPAGTRVVRTGNPVRTEIVVVPERRSALAGEARAAFSLEEGRFTVLVLGGSLGALALDRIVAETLPSLRDRTDLQLLVSAGRDHVDVVDRAIERDAPLLVRVLPFIERMDLALAVAELAVSRAGASVAELAVTGVPSVLVPYPYATERHQEGNAQELVAAGAAEMVLEPDLSPRRLASCILELMQDDERRRRMAGAARAWARPDAAERVAELALEVTA